ncbi:hypothetical protein BSKO_05143 [Bryopsis sp. KO-2023]|nr:hypothetical protein BSKO_05143 [Bryopsis sp. KO-2023]
MMNSIPLPLDRCLPHLVSQVETKRFAPGIVSSTTRVSNAPAVNLRPHSRKDSSARRSVRVESSLATYSVEQQKCSPILERVVQESVRHLDKAPCLHLLVEDATFETHSVPEAVVAAPQLWQGITEHLSSRNPDAVVLVHRVPEGGESKGCMDPALPSSSEAGLTCSNRLLSVGLAQQIMAGKIGECCDDEEHHAPESQGFIDMALRHSGMYGEESMSASSMYQDTAFWGLIIQSAKCSELQGCYLLKTMRLVDSTGCCCTHFSLTRVCAGVPLCDQYSASWLI